MDPYVVMLKHAGLAPYTGLGLFDPRTVLLKHAGFGSVAMPAVAAGAAGVAGYNIGHTSAHDAEAARQKSLRNRAIGAGVAAGMLGPDILQNQQGSAALGTVGKLVNLDRLSGG